MNWTRDLLDSYTRDRQAERAYNRSLSSGTMNPVTIALGVLAAACIILPRLLYARYPSLNTVFQYANYLGFAAMFGAVAYTMNPNRKRSVSGGRKSPVTCSHCNRQMERVTVIPKRGEIKTYGGHDGSGGQHVTKGRSGKTYVHSHVAGRPYVYTVSQDWYVCDKCKRGLISRKCEFNEIVGDMNPPPPGATTGDDIIAKLEGQSSTRKTIDHLSKKKIVIKKDG